MASSYIWFFRYYSNEWNSFYFSKTSSAWEKISFSLLFGKSQVAICFGQNKNSNKKKRRKETLPIFSNEEPIPAGEKGTDLGTEGKIMRILDCARFFQKKVWTAVEAAQAIQSGFQRSFVQAEYDLLPIGDGGKVRFHH